MREIRDKKIIYKYLTENNIPDLFDNPDLPFHLYEYEQGEIMNYLHPTKDYLKFLVEGQVSLFSIRDDGEIFLIYKGSNWVPIGISELTGYSEENQYHEAITKVKSIELKVYDVKDKILSDRKFLRYMLKCLGRRISRLVNIVEYRPMTVEKRIIIYLKEKNKIKGIENLSLYLKCSRSQVQRALKKLVDDKSVKRVGKGEYELINSDIHT